MRTYVETLNDWHSRLTRLELQIALNEPTGGISWHLRIQAKVLQFLLARYTHPVWEPPLPRLTTNLPLTTITRWPAADGRFDRDQGDCAAFIRTSLGESQDPADFPELTWSEVCYCLLPWDEPYPPPGSEEFENRPRPREAIAEALHNIHALNTTPRRSWFNLRKEPRP